MAAPWNHEWVKERITAFLCRETNWLAARWIQTHLFLCPGCRREYKSLKKVWNELDQWEIEEPSPDLEASFHEAFRNRYPSAFRQNEHRSGGWMDGVPRLVYVSFVVLLGTALFYFNPVPPSATFRHSVVPDSDRVAEAPEGTVKFHEVPADTSEHDAGVRVAQNEGTADSAGHREASTVRERNLGGRDSLSPLHPTGTARIVTTSTLSPGTGRTRYMDVNRSKRTLSINNVVLSDFSSLNSPYEEEHPY